MTKEDIATHNAPLYVQIERLCKVTTDAWLRGDMETVWRLVQMRCETAQQLLPQ